MKFSTIATLLFTSAGVTLAAPGATLTKRAPATAIESVTGDNGITTPLPIQPGMVDNCDKFYFVKAQDNCLKISAEFGISFDQFKEWNPTVGKDCLSLWADANVCVRTIDFKYPEKAVCFNAAGAIPWGQDKNDAIKAVAAWCSGGGGNGIYNVDEVRKTCVNAPSGNGKFLFTVYNQWGVRKALINPPCSYNVGFPIHECEAGAQAYIQSWKMETFHQEGKC
ncbi:hypothetical protein FHETE_979 [Fusarium heterosporum]|uniref:LysM domain-containing protein n=1 Tax=Fusarium heterosporum TaxID=42747 RepID=A0A8H5TYQ7_FUSHE|nr:hypothetical protein FHETE_979 [Fusarium heterosporum]